MPDQPAERNSSGAPTRNYVILERHQFEDDDGYYFVEATIVEARNTSNALRKAWKALDKGGEENVMLVPVPQNWWRPRPVSGKPRDDYTVEIGEPVAS